MLNSISSRIAWSRKNRFVLCTHRGRVISCGAWAYNRKINAVWTLGDDQEYFFDEIFFTSLSQSCKLILVRIFRFFCSSSHLKNSFNICWPDMTEKLLQLLLCKCASSIKKSFCNFVLARNKLETWDIFAHYLRLDGHTKMSEFIDAHFIF